MEKDYLILKRASLSRPSGQWNEEDYDVLANGEVVGRIFKANAAPVGSPWMWTLAFGHHEDRTPTHGYAATRDSAMAAFAKSWRRESSFSPCCLNLPSTGRAHHARSGAASTRRGTHHAIGTARRCRPNPHACLS